MISSLWSLRKLTDGGMHVKSYISVQQKLSPVDGESFPLDYRSTFPGDFAIGERRWWLHGKTLARHIYLDARPLVEIFYQHNSDWYCQSISSRGANTACGWASGWAALAPRGRKHAYWRRRSPVRAADMCIGAADMRIGRIKEKN